MYLPERHHDSLLSLGLKRPNGSRSFHGTAHLARGHIEMAERHGTSDLKNFSSMTSGSYFDDFWELRLVDLGLKSI